MAPVCHTYIRCRLAFVLEIILKLLRHAGYLVHWISMAKGLSPSWSTAFTSFNALMLQNRQVPWLEAFGRDNPGSIFTTGTWGCMRVLWEARCCWLAVGAKVEYHPRWQNLNPISRQSQSDEWSAWIVFKNFLHTNRRVTRCMSIEPTASLRHSGAWLTCWGSRTRWSLFGPQQWNCERGGAPKYAEIQTILIVTFSEIIFQL